MAKTIRLYQSEAMTSERYISWQHASFYYSIYAYYWEK